MNGEIQIFMSLGEAETAANVLAAAGCRKAAQSVRVGLLKASSDESHFRRLCDGADEGKLDRMIEDAEEQDSQVEGVFGLAAIDKGSDLERCG